MRRSLAALLLVAACGSGTSTTAPSPPPSPSPSPSAVATTPAAPAAPAAGADWTTYGGDPQRSSSVPTGPDPDGAAVAWKADLDGRVYASPLVIGGRVIAATEGGSLYALDLRTGSVVWRAHPAAPLPGDALPCGDIDPISFTGAPVYDPPPGVVFSVAPASGVKHALL